MLLWIVLECGGSTPLWIALDVLVTSLRQSKTIQSGVEPPHSRTIQSPARKQFRHRRFGCGQFAVLDCSGVRRLDAALDCFGCACHLPAPIQNDPKRRPAAALQNNPKLGLEPACSPSFQLPPRPLLELFP